MLAKLEELSCTASTYLGRPLTFVVIVLWLIAAFSYWFITGREPETLEVINIMISVFTLLCLPLIQGSSNRDGAAIQGKTDMIVKAIPQASDSFVGLDKHTIKEIEEKRKEVDERS